MYPCGPHKTLPEWLRPWKISGIISRRQNADKEGIVMLLNILAVGDVVGEGGQDILHRRLPKLREETGAHFAVVNGENASGPGRA